MNLPAKWTLPGLSARLRDVIREPADVALAMRIGFFLWRAPYALSRRHLQAYLHELERRRPRSGRRRDGHHARIERIRGAWLRMPFCRKRDSCYLRSLTLYRFWDIGDDVMHLHFGVEEREDPQALRHAHVWISVGGRTYEGPPPSASRLQAITLTRASV